MAGFTIGDAMLRERHFDFQCILLGLYRIAEIDITYIELLGGMDRVDVGVDRARLQFQVRSTRFCNVAHSANNDIPAAVWRVERGAQRLMAGIAAIGNLDDRAIEL